MARAGFANIRELVPDVPPRLIADRNALTTADYCRQLSRGAVNFSRPGTFDCW
jgi:hypothetical protein